MTDRDRPDKRKDWPDNGNQGETRKNDVGDNRETDKKPPKQTEGNDD